MLARIAHFNRSTPLSTVRLLAGVNPIAIQTKLIIRTIHVTSRSSNPSNSASLFSTSVRRRSDLISPVMSSDDSRSPQSDSPAEEFVYVDEGSPNLGFQDLEESVLSVDAHSVNEDDASGVAGEGEGEERKVLPEDLSRGVMMLSCESSAVGGNCDVYVVGTAHVSRESCNEVQAVISFLKPQVVFLELCSSRLAVLRPQDLKVPSMGEMLEMWKKNHNLFGILYSWFLSKVANKLEIFPGSEFRVAFEEAMKYGGKVILGDRPVHITLRRTWGKMPLWHKTKLMYSLLFQSFFLPSSEALNKMLKDFDDVDMLTLVIQEMSKQFPTLMETLVQERDMYMSSTLLRVAREHSSVVAVVGKGHLQGIKKHWKQPVEVKDLLKMPSQKPGVSPAKVLKALGVAVVGVAIVSGVYLSSKK